MTSGQFINSSSSTWSQHTKVFLSHSILGPSVMAWEAIYRVSGYTFILLLLYIYFGTSTL